MKKGIGTASFSPVYILFESLLFNLKAVAVAVAVAVACRIQLTLIIFFAQFSFTKPSLGRLNQRNVMMNC